MKTYLTNQNHPKCNQDLMEAEAIKAMQLYEANQIVHNQIELFTFLGNFIRKNPSPEVCELLPGIETVLFDLFCLKNDLEKNFN